MTETTDLKTEQRAFLRDADGNRTEDPSKAVGGEVVSHDEEGRVRRTWFLFEEVDIKWLPVNESAFLLWVLVALFGTWLVIGVVLGLI
jgi:hypothetical protein